MTQGARHLVAGFAILLVIAGIAGGLMILGPPSEERIRRLDQNRVEDLQGIAETARIFRTRHGRLPASLNELAGEPGFTAPRDPETRKEYEYRPVDDQKFELCAVFARESRFAAGPVGGRFWSHAAGRQCFQPTASDLEPQGLNFVR